jgi:RecJ-like exonuclease
MPSTREFLDSFKIPSELLHEKIEEDIQIRIVTHNDADGLASGGILSKVITRLGASWKTSCLKKIDEKTLMEIRDEENPFIIFSDFGSGYLSLIDNILEDSLVIILDHHLPEDYTVDRVIQVNPVINGLDGARDIASSGICYLLAKEMEENNTDLSMLGLIGALGDQQDKGEGNSLTGLNQIIEKDAIEGDLLKKHRDLIFYGYETRPIAKALAYTTNPFIPGLSGREDNTVAFLKKLRINLKEEGKWRTLRDLSEEEKQHLFSSLSNHMISEGLDSEAIHQLIGTIYTLKREEPWTPLRDGREYSSLLNACARMGRPGLGLCICLGDRDLSLKEAEDILMEYRRRIGMYISWVESEDRIEELDQIYILRGEDHIPDTMIGVVASILLSHGILDKFKPIIATSFGEDGLLKVSGRSTDKLLDKGLHLGKSMQEAAADLEGVGGGHDIAAGAYLPLTKEDKFIEKVNKIVSREIRK